MRFQRLHLASGLFLGALFVHAGCSRPFTLDSSLEQFGVARGALVGGVNDEADLLVNSVVALASPDAPSVVKCSGVRMSTTLVLTARQCVSSSRAGLTEGNWRAAEVGGLRTKMSSRSDPNVSTLPLIRHEVSRGGLREQARSVLTMFTVVNDDPTTQKSLARDVG